MATQNPSYHTPSGLPPPPHYQQEYVHPHVAASSLYIPSTAHEHQGTAPPSGAQSDDMKYMTKYKEMKRKVKDIELENDRLHLKCLKTRKNIGRLRLERAILYERLATIPAAEEALLPGEPGFHAGAHSQQPHPVDAQGPLGQSVFSSEVQARIHADKERAQSEAAHQGYSRRLIGAQVPIEVRPSVAQPTQRQYTRRPDDSPPISYPQIDVPMRIDPPPPGPAPAKPRHRKPASQSDQTHTSPPLPASGSIPPPSTFQETWKAGPRTYPFVLEYQHNTESEEPNRGPPTPGYPSEIRFHQYDTSDRPAHRSRRDFDLDTDKSAITYKPRASESNGDHRVGRPDSHSRSPRGTSSSSQIRPAYPARPLIAPDREAQPQRVLEGERGPQRDSHVPQNGLGSYPDEWRRHEAEVNGFGLGNGHPHHLEHDVRQLREDAVRHIPPITKRSVSQFDQEHPNGDYDNYTRERDRRDHHKRAHRSRDVEDEQRVALPRVREGEAMD